jgi:hypothetical protein
MKNAIAPLLLILLVGSAGLAAPAELHSQELGLSRGSPAATSDSASVALVTALLDLPAAPPPDAYSITGYLLPPFLQAVIAAWNREFPSTPLSANSIIFVIRPDEFYDGLEPPQKAWLMSREMLGIRNFPVIINPLTPQDDWYLRAQWEWKQGNREPIYILLTSLFHEMTHTQKGGTEAAAYKDQLKQFETFQRQGKLSSPYAGACHESLRRHYVDLKKHPEQYRQVFVNLQRQTVALVVHAEDTAYSTLSGGRQ